MISLKDDPEAFPVRQLTILGEWSLMVAKGTTRTDCHFSDMSLLRAYSFQLYSGLHICHG